MRKTRIALALLAGCAPFNALVEKDARNTATAPDKIRNARRIVVEYGSYGIHSGSESTSWILEADGNCRYETMRDPSTRMGGRLDERPKPQINEVSSATFREVQRLLIESKLWTVKARDVFEFEGSVHFSVAWDGHKYAFRYYPEESNQLVAYLRGLPPLDPRK